MAGKFFNKKKRPKSRPVVDINQGVPGKGLWDRMVSGVKKRIDNPIGTGKGTGGGVIAAKRKRKEDLEEASK